MKVLAATAMICCLFLSGIPAKAQSHTNSIQTKTSLFEGIVVLGYADHGAYLNCTGPSLKFSKQPYVLLLGLLPSLRIKKDQVAPGVTRNAAITPNLGAGLSLAWQHLVLQLPLFYNAKTTVKDGKWRTGIGIGYKF